MMGRGAKASVGSSESSSESAGTGGALGKDSGVAGRTMAGVDFGIHGNRRTSNKRGISRADDETDEEMSRGIGEEIRVPLGHSPS